MRTAAAAKIAEEEERLKNHLSVRFFFLLFFFLPLFCKDRVARMKGTLRFSEDFSVPAIGL
jgi:hypothetical protein